jgi:hypothetical protein
MTAAAVAQEFERAAVLRDRLEGLEWLNRHLVRLRRAAAHSFVYPVVGHDGAEIWYLIRQGRVLTALPRPLDASARAAVATTLTAVFSRERFDPLATEETDGVLLVASWFTRHPAERERTRDWRDLVYSPGANEDPQTPV